MAEIAEKSQRLVAEFLQAAGPRGRGSAWPTRSAIGAAFLEMTARMMADPSRLVQAQLSLWNDYLTLWQRTAQRFLGGDRRAGDRAGAPATGASATRRGPKTRSSTSSSRAICLTARWMQATVRDVEGLDERTARKVDFYTRQFVDAIAPSNFLMTNPEVLRATIESRGENLVNGLKNLLDDLERGKGRLAIKMTEWRRSSIGENIAVTPGKVVYQNELMQLIQYEPTTEKVKRRPLLIIPPWINKFYILDLRPGELLHPLGGVAGPHGLRDLLGQPRRAARRQELRRTTCCEGPLAALDAIEQATGEREANVIGYCLGGTLLAARSPIWRPSATTGSRARPIS